MDFIDTINLHKLNLCFTEYNFAQLWDTLKPETKVNGYANFSGWNVEHTLEMIQQ